MSGMRRNLPPYSQGCSVTYEGGCLCGAVRFEADGPLRAVLPCHCTQCRKVSGHFWAATSVPHDRFRLTRDDGLRWYRSSPTARRGFCGRCGATLFWQPEGEARLSISPGAFDGDLGLAGDPPIFTEDRGDYYNVDGPPPPPDPAPPARLSGTCLCGACAFALPGPAGPVTACHCDQCRRLSGHFAASFDASEDALDWLRRDALAEYETPGGAQRGFCRDCGSSLYFRAADGSFSVEAGIIDGKTGGRLAEHIFVAGKGSYYEVTDGLPAYAGSGTLGTQA